jgi:hypothetical protein
MNTKTTMAIFAIIATALALVMATSLAVPVLAAKHSSNDNQGTGSNDNQGTGSNDNQGTGSNDNQGTGSNDNQGTPAADPATSQGVKQFLKCESQAAKEPEGLTRDKVRKCYDEVFDLHGSFISNNPKDTSSTNN